MATNVDVKKNNNESSINLIRRFSRKVRSIGFTRELKGKRYFQRADSDLRRKRGALAREENRKRYETMRKLGKI